MPADNNIPLNPLETLPVITMRNTLWEGYQFAPDMVVAKLCPTCDKVHGVLSLSEFEDAQRLQLVELKYEELPCKLESAQLKFKVAQLKLKNGQLKLQAAEQRLEMVQIKREMAQLKSKRDRLKLKEDQIKSEMAQLMDEMDQHVLEKVQQVVEMARLMDEMGQLKLELEFRIAKIVSDFLYFLSQQVGFNCDKA